MTRILSLAAGVCPETAPADFVSACAEAGWNACGVWFDPETWTNAVARDVRQRLDDAGMIALDVEPVFVTPSGDHGQRLIDAAAAVNARNILVVNRGAEEGQFVERFAELCVMSAGANVGCCLEFLPIMSLKTLPEALKVVAAVDHPNAAVLVDSHHLDRTGATPADLADVDPKFFRYAQLNDAAADPGDDLLVDAVDLRSSPGEGDLPLIDLVDALPAELPLSMEVRSASLRATFPDPADRARSVLEATRRFFAENNLA